MHSAPRSRAIKRLVVCTLFCLLIVGFTACKDRNRPAAEARWDKIADENNDFYFIDRTSIRRISDTVVRVSIKYSPSNGGFLTSMQELSKDFGGTAQDIAQEYSISAWEFNCEKKEARCLNLTHYRKGAKVATYDYPHPVWRQLDQAPSTELLRDLVCAKRSS